MKIGYKRKGYPQNRNILGQIENVKYIKTIDYFKIVSSLEKKIFKKINLSNEYKYFDFNINKVDFYHFFNSINYGTKPWISTFETIIPRFENTMGLHVGENPDFKKIRDNKEVLKAIKQLASNNCKKIIAISKFSNDLQLKILEEFPKYKDKIKNKITILHPPQEILVDYDKKSKMLNDEKIKFAFVGRAFFRKGGLETLKAFVNIKEKYNYNLELTIISSLGMDKYAACETEKDLKEAKQILESNKDFIKHYIEIPNKEVLEILKNSHIGLLPTYSDTYGYSLLEFQASGCPVISTNTGALSEINNNEIGWLIKLPLNNCKEAIYTTEKSRKEINKIIITEMEKIIINIFENKDQISKKSKLVLERLEKEHSNKEYKLKLLKIYKDSFNNKKFK